MLVKIVVGIGSIISGAMVVWSMILTAKQSSQRFLRLKRRFPATDQRAPLWFESLGITIMAACGISAVWAGLELIWPGILG